MASKKVAKHNEAWWAATRAGLCDHGWFERQAARLQREADLEWDEAEVVSVAAGHPFKNRHGEVVTPKPREVGILERVVTELRRQVEAQELQWPQP